MRLRGGLPPFKRERYGPRQKKAFLRENAPIAPTHLGKLQNAARRTTANAELLRGQDIGRRNDAATARRRALQVANAQWISVTAVEPDPGESDIGRALVDILL